MENLRLVIADCLSIALTRYQRCYCYWSHSISVRLYIAFDSSSYDLALYSRTLE